MRILEINNCIECPFSNHEYKSCNEKDYVIDNYPNIPKWCHLKDEGQIKKAVVNFDIIRNYIWYDDLPLHVHQSLLELLEYFEFIENRIGN